MAMLPNGRLGSARSTNRPASEPIASIQLSGARDVVAAFRDLREYLPKTPLRSAVHKAAQMLEGYIVLLAPKLTGKLARNIAVKVRRSKATVRGRVTINTEGDAKNTKNAFYWRFLEEGFQTRAGNFVKLPFIITAFNALKDKAAQSVVDAVDKAIQRAEKKAKRAALGSRS